MKTTDESSGCSSQVEQDLLVELRDVRHCYGASIALESCQLQIRKGEVHGLVGENGSGKSTVVKLLSGVMTPTSGMIAVNGRNQRFTSPSSAQRAGIVTVFQETLIADECTVLENIFLGADGLFKRSRSRENESKTVLELLECLELPESCLTTPPSRLSLATRQTLTIARALAREWQLLVLDEATSALDLATRNRLFEIITRNRELGRSVLFVSHRMDELKLIIDRATVQRSGVTVGTLDRHEVTPQRLLDMMAGRDHLSSDAATPEESHTRVESVVNHQPHVVVRCTGVSLAPSKRNFDLEIHSGEILGVAGLDGHGSDTLLETLAGRRLPSNGEIEITREGRPIGIRNYHDANRKGIAYVPAKRQEEGLFPTLSVWDNMSIATLARRARAGLFLKKAVDQSVDEQMASLGVVPNDTSMLVSGLSGGNAQKVLLGRWLATKPWLLLLNDPLRGVDHGTKLDFYVQLKALANAGMSVVLLSTEIEELINVSQRVVICRDHSIEAQLSGESLTYDGILAAMFGQSGLLPTALDSMMEPPR
jgi:ribose transport system ATP-binding protein